MTRFKKISLRLLLPIAFVVGSLTGCSTGASYYAPYRPTEHQVMLVLLPRGQAGNVMGRVLDRMENAPYRIVSIPEEECGLRSDTEKLYHLLHRANGEIAAATARAVNATLVVYEDAEPVRKSSSYAPVPQPEPGTSTQDLTGRGASNPLPTEESQLEETTGGMLRIAVYDVRTQTILWHEKIALRPSQGAIEEFAKRLMSNGG